MADDEDTRSLVEGASQGDPIAVDRLLERYLPDLRGFIRLRSGPIIRDREAVSDIAQSVCREVLQNADRFRYGGEAKFKHWLYTTALRLIQNRATYWKREKRDHRREVRIEDRGEGRPNVLELLHCYGSLGSPSLRLRTEDEIQRIERAFDQLSEDHREVITLSRIVGLSHAEIAERMDRTEEAARTLLHRALATFAMRLEQTGGS